ncbi:glycine cleavage system T protein [Melioribacter roseus P3M-2]|uniref:Aminomethyltransferase n=1 Tax=Melioribacter roseus (strain DSM 23840 / JCM 17771 / VKM B-2668 / P3M-2) TaxID=1191523 RepID=I7A511_MELRP|nr:glycine cleavage system aminomethyltransferase GcvT [Melioribacter roseus]AFN74961.1 glycine cleavage system T protein [Melioribacter roseus P3M-2]
MKTTKFYSVHQKLNAKIVDFAGFKMPIQYTSIIEEHKAVRSSVGVFDVSHMGEIIIKGEKALDFVQYVTTNDASVLTDGRVQYSLLCYEDGGIVDDLLVYRINQNEFIFVVNAANKDKDYDWLLKNNKFDVEIKDESDEYSLLAVQGPNSKAVLQKICDRELNLEYYHFFYAKIAGNDALISRTGYTGELGYEIYFKGDEDTAIKIWNSIFEAGKEFDIKPVGLGARDTLRLEMGYCLYGNDIDKSTNPLEASLGWVVKLKKNNFIGKEALLRIKEDGLKRKLAPMVSHEKAFPRHGHEVTADGNIIGKITSGTVSPIIEKAIALGYIDINYASEGTQVNFLIRGKEIPATVTKLPFIKN